MTKKITVKKLGSVESVTMMVARDSLKPAPWNPEIRSRTRYLLPLRESMEANGFWDYRPILCDRNGMIIDGHRRWAVAGALGISLVPATIVDDDADRLWAEVNGTTMVISGGQVMQAAAGGLQAKPRKYKDALEKIHDLMGEEGVKFLAARGVGPSIMKAAERIARYCTMTTDKEFLRAVIKWLVTNPRANIVTIQAMKDNVAPGRIYKAIQENRLLEARYE